MSDFSLDPRLDADTLLLGDLALSRVLLLNDKRFPGSSWCRGCPLSRNIPTSHRRMPAG